MRLEVEVCRAADALGPEWDPLFEAAGDVQLSRAWFRANAEAALAPGAEPAFVAMSDADGPAALIPMQQGSRPEWIFAHDAIHLPVSAAAPPRGRPGP